MADWLTINAAMQGLNGVQLTEGWQPAVEIQTVKRTEGDPYALYDMPLEGGHNGKNQYRGEHLGLCNPICVA